MNTPARKVETAEHTAGPWTAHSATVDQHWPVSAEYGEGRACIAHVNAEDIDREEARANARLIAAAPDMLALLKAMVAKHQAPETSEDIAEFDELMCAAQLLIAKAEPV